jgi:hypothetical protein
MRKAGWLLSFLLVGVLPASILSLAPIKEAGAATSDFGTIKIEENTPTTHTLRPRFIFPQSALFSGVDYHIIDGSYKTLQDYISVNGVSMASINASYANAAKSWTYDEFPSNIGDATYQVPLMAFAQSNFLELRIHENFRKDIHGLDLGLSKGFSITSSGTTYSLAQDAIFRYRKGWALLSAEDYTLSGVSSTSDGTTLTIHLASSSLMGVGSASLEGISFNGAALSAIAGASASFDSDGLTLSLPKNGLALTDASTLEVKAGYQNALGRSLLKALKVTYDSASGSFYDASILEHTWNTSLHILKLSKIQKDGLGYGFSVTFNHPLLESGTLSLTGNLALDKASGALSDDQLLLYTKGGIAESVGNIELNGTALSSVSDSSVKLTFGQGGANVLYLWSKTLGSVPLLFQGKNSIAFPSDFRGFAFYSMADAVSYTYDVQKV